MVNMFDKLSSTEIVYTKKFAQTYESNELIRFYDDTLPDMYVHNFTLIKNCVSMNAFRKLILEELDYRRKASSDFLRIEFNFTIKDDFLNNLPVVPLVTKYDYMYIEPKMSSYLIGNAGCTIHKALSEKVLKAGIEVDILANKLAMGEEFARKRIYRKSQIYKQIDSNLDLYVCDYKGIAIGNCEFMIDHNVVKIEDFDILEDYQRKGFGTSVLKHLLEEANTQHAEFAYLLTDNEGTAKEMYTKCGFKQAGEKTELFFKLR